VALYLIAPSIALVGAGAVLAARARFRLRRIDPVRIGVDIVEVRDVASALASPRAERYLRLVYGAGERRDCSSPGFGVEPSRLAARFAAKEAVRKAIGGAALEAPWTSIQVERGPGGEPLVRLAGPAAAAARELGLRRFAVSLSHEPGYAAAMVVATR